MQVEIPDSVIDALRDSLTPVLDRLITEHVEQKRPMLLSMTQVAEELSCSRSSVYGLIHAGHLEAIRIGRTYRVATATLQDYVEELTTPSYQRDVVTARARPSRVTRPASTASRSKMSQTPVTSVVPATRPPRPPRQRQTKISKKDVAESRCTVAELGERWWGLSSATALLERSGVHLTESAEGPETFRYGDLVAWVESHHSEFEQWLGEFDPTLRHTNVDQ